MKDIYTKSVAMDLDNLAESMKRAYELIDKVDPPVLVMLNHEMIERLKNAVPTATSKLPLLAGVKLIENNFLADNMFFIEYQSGRREVHMKRLV